MIERDIEKIRVEWKKPAETFPMYQGFENNLRMLLRDNASLRKIPPKVEFDIARIIEELFLDEHIFKGFEFKNETELNGRDEFGNKKNPERIDFLDIANNRGMELKFFRKRDLSAQRKLLSQVLRYYASNMRVVFVLIWDTNEEEGEWNFDFDYWKRLIQGHPAKNRVMLIPVKAPYCK